MAHDRWPYVAYWDLRLVNATNYRIVYENLSVQLPDPGSNKTYFQPYQIVKIMSLNGTLLFADRAARDWLKEGGWMWKANVTPSLERSDVAGLCLHDLSSGRVRLLDLAWANPDGFSRDLGFCSPGRILVDSFSGWVGY